MSDEDHQVTYYEREVYIQMPIDQLEPLDEIVLPENIVYQQEKRYLGNLAFSLDEMHKPSNGLRKLLPVEYAYASTKDLPNSTFIIMQRYPNLPYWNRYYSNHYIEDMSQFTYTKPNAHHVYRFYNDACAHFMVEDTASELDGYKVCHSVLAFTY